MRKNTITGFVLLGSVIGCYLLIARLDLKKNAQKNKETAMAAEKASSGKITLPSGLSYEPMHYGGSELTPQPGDQLQVHYTGWLDDGTGRKGREFDSSYKRNEPLTFLVGQGMVIRGWDEGLLKMRLGDIFRLFIPPHLAYGVDGYPPVIPGNAALIFDVKLVAINERV
jgi:FKBP-type peptidyl-prolyl cis-trans isomerase